MITEDYVSFEIAKLLKEKGFDWGCIGYYVDYEPDDVKYSFLYETNSTLESRCCSAPTLQMVTKWLREVHRIFIEISVSIDLNGKYHYRYFILNRECKYVRIGYSDFDWDYEQTCEAALKYTLENLI